MWQSLLFSCKLSFPIVSLKMSSLPTLALKSPNKIFVWYLGIYRIHVLILRGTCSSYCTVLCPCGSNRTSFTSDTNLSRVLVSVTGNKRNSLEDWPTPLQLELQSPQSLVLLVFLSRFTGCTGPPFLVACLLATDGQLLSPIIICIH
jgi:hypothetical protein